jgi:DNA-binding IclR family transcriptional regulator
MSIKAMDKMFKILSIFTMERTTLSINEIANETGYPKSTIFRILNTLEKGEFIKRNLDTHRYSLGFQFFRLGSIVQSELDFRQVALPVMKKLSEQTKETVEINIIDHIYRVCIEKIDSTLDVRNFVRIGERKPIYSGASGKVLLAFTKSEVRGRILNELQEEIPLDLPKLNEHLAEITTYGYAITRGERVSGSFAVSAPIFDYSGELVASLTIAGPIQRLSDEREQELIAILKEGASEISHQLGFVNNKIVL